jgi:uncharacterized protein
VTAPPAADFLRGVAHFNRGEFFEAHEAWELVWRETSGPRADFYKGLIQCAVALHHARRGNLEGARRLYHRQKRYLSGFCPTMLGLPVADLLARMDTLFAPILAAKPGEPVTLDLDRIPTIALEPDPGESPGAQRG